MSTSPSSPPLPINEPVLSYAPGSSERAELKRELERMSKTPVDVPLFIGGREERTGNVVEIRSPHDHSARLGTFHEGTPDHAKRAVAAALAARADWSNTSQADRSGVFLRAAEIAAGRHRAKLNASTMLGQSKTAYQAEIDASCELVDFLRFNAHWADTLAEPLVQAPGIWNHTEMRPLEGFVAAITPFNFTAIAANLPMAAAVVGNVVVWKPSPLAMRSTLEVMDLFRLAGLPDGVINLVTGPPEPIVHTLLDHEKLAGVHFTGSTPVFQSIHARVGANVARYACYPRLVGETGGKDFVFAHASADVEALAVALIRGAFEFQGQKCSAASRAYIPKSIWNEVRDRVAAIVPTLAVGDVSDFRSFMGAVIDGRAFDRLSAVQEEAKSSSTYRVITGGTSNSEKGWFVAPTLVESTDPRARLMTEEFFGPILTAFVYDDADLDGAFALCDESTRYALTGAIFGRDRAFVAQARARLRDAAGNFYINDKPTGAVVGQQPFGGGRASGTNDKAGSPENLRRWVSPRSIKETLDPPRAVPYPSMSEP